MDCGELIVKAMTVAEAGVEAHPEAKADPEAKANGSAPNTTLLSSLCTFLFPFTMGISVYCLLPATSWSNFTK